MCNNIKFKYFIVLEKVDINNLS